MEEGKSYIIQLHGSYFVVTKDFIEEDELFILDNKIYRNTNVTMNNLCKESKQLKVIATQGIIIDNLPVIKYKKDELDKIFNERTSYSEQDLIDACKYGYEYHQTTSFPDKTFEQNCINNFKQSLVSKQKTMLEIDYSLEDVGNLMNIVIFK